MNRFLILACFEFICIQGVHATARPLGGEIYYEHVSGSTYMVYLNYYFNCNGIAPTSAQFSVTDGTATSTYIATQGSSYTYDLNIPSGQCTRCSDANCSFPFGILMRTYYAKVDVSSFKGCHITFSWSICCTSNAITTISQSEIYIEALLNRCMGDQSSPQFQEQPPFIVMQYKKVDLYQSVYPGNKGDTIKYALVPPLQGPGKPISYYTNYGYDHPFIYGGTSITDPIPDGFHYNSATGKLNFTSQNVDLSAMAVQANEYSIDSTGHSYLAGTTMRFFTIACLQYDSVKYDPVIYGINNTGSDSIYSCSNVPLKFQVRCFDQDTSKKVSLNAINETGGTLSYSSSRTPITTFTWTPANKDVSPYPYHIILTARDNDAPVCNIVQRCFYVFITDSIPDMKITRSDSGCGRYQFSAPVYPSLPIKYTWMADSNIVSHNASFVYTFPFNGQHVITLIADNQWGCEKIVTDTLNIKILPAIVAMGDTLICPGSSARLQAKNGIRYSWYPAAGLSADTGASVLASPLQTTKYFVSGSDKNGCLAIDSVMVMVDTLKVNPIKDTTICKGAYIYMHASANKKADYRWETNSGVLLSDSAGLFARINTETSYRVIATDSLGCTGSYAGIIKPDQPVVHAGADVSICNGDSVQLHASGVGSFRWNIAPGLPIGATIPDPWVNPTQNQNFVVAAKDSLGCQATDTVKVHVSNIPPLYVRSATVCHGDSVRLLASGGQHYQWSPNAGLNNATSATPFAAPETTTTYHVFICDSLCTCSRNDSITVNVTPFIKEKAGRDTSVCQGVAVGIGQQALPGYSYTWYSQPPGYSGTAALDTVSPQKTTRYFRYLRNKTNGCSSLDSVTVTVVPGVHPAISGAETACQGDTLFYQADTNDPDITYSWKFSSRGQLVIKARNYIDLSWDSAGNCSLWLTEQNQDGCSDSIEKQIKTIPYPHPAIDAGKNVCLGSPVHFDDKDTAATSYAWDFGDGGTSNLNAPDYVYKNGGSYRVVLRTSNGNCSATDTSTINVSSLAGLHPQVIHTGFRQYLFDNKDSADIYGLWFPGTGDSFAYYRIPYKYADTGNYEVIFRYAGRGCSGVFDTVIHVDDVLPPVYRDTVYILPNPFSDRFDVHYTLSKTETISIRMYDDQGKLLLRVEKVNLPPGNYVYTFTAKEHRPSPAMYLLKYYNGEKVTVFKEIRQ